MAGRLRTVTAPPFYSSYASNDTALRSSLSDPYTNFTKTPSQTLKKHKSCMQAPQPYSQVPNYTHAHHSQQTRFHVKRQPTTRSTTVTWTVCKLSYLTWSFCCALAHVALSNLSICFSHTIELGLGNLREGSEG